MDPVVFNLNEELSKFSPDCSDQNYVPRKKWGRSTVHITKLPLVYGERKYRRFLFFQANNHQQRVIGRFYLWLPNIFQNTVDEVLFLAMIVRITDISERWTLKNLQGSHGNLGLILEFYPYEEIPWSQQIFFLFFY